MTKKHFIELARYIIIHRDAFTDEAIGVIANFCQSQNGNFKRERWLDFIAGRCGPNGGEIKP